jgi:hypothetical protein
MPFEFLLELAADAMEMAADGSPDGKRRRPFSGVFGAALWLAATVTGSALVANWSGLTRARPWGLASSSCGACWSPRSPL